jgi:CHAT domain-containing protein
VRRRIVQGQVFCRLKKSDEANAVWAQAEGLIPQRERSLGAELAFAQGLCQIFADPTSAERHFNHAVDLAHGSDPFIEASALGGIGYLLLKAGRCDPAIEKFNGVLQLTDSDSYLLRERALGNAAECYAELGDWRQSVSFAEQAQKLAAQIGNDGDRKTWLIDLGRATFALRRIQGYEAEAEGYYLEALSLARRLGDRPGSAACFNNLTRLALRRHDLAKAEEYLAQGKALNVANEDSHFALDAAEIVTARKQWSEAEQLFQELLPRTAKDAILLSMVQRDLGNVYAKEGKIPEAHQAFQAGIKTAEQAVRKLNRPEYRMSFMDQDPFYDSYIHFLVEQNQPEKALRIAERSRAQVLAAALENGKASEPLLSVSALKALSKRSGQIILTYAMTDEVSFLWVITPSDFKLFRLPISHRELFTQIDAFNNEIQNRRNIEASPAGQKLYENLIQPAEKLIRSGSSIVIVPSKLLSLVNFEALIVPETDQTDSHYWLKDVNVQVAGSLALFAKSKPAARKDPPGMKELLALGAPIQANPDFPTLKHALEEIQRVQKHFPAQQTNVISGLKATPEAYRTSNPGRYRFLHLDTHGVPSDLNPLDSAIILSPGKNNLYRLPANAIKDIPLRADLVTISACYGAGTRLYQGEGLVGLAWAFLHAGAHQVVGALWEVDEASSPQLMDDFYAELAKGKSAAEALRTAKLKMLHSGGSYSHPYYWASLQVYTGS